MPNEVCASAVTPCDGHAAAIKFALVGNPTRRFPDREVVIHMTEAEAQAIISMIKAQLLVNSSVKID